MEDFTLSENDNPAAVKKAGGKFRSCLLWVVLVPLLAFAYWRYGINRPEDPVLALLDRYHNLEDAELVAFFHSTVDTTIGEVSPAVFDLIRSRLKGVVVFAKKVRVDGDQAWVTVAGHQGNFALWQRLLMRWFGFDYIRCPEGGMSSLRDQTFKVAKSKGKWKLAVTAEDFERACAANRRILMAAVEQYEIIERGDKPSNIQQLREAGFFHVEPKCYAGGVYTLEPVETCLRVQAKCSLHD